MKNNLPLPVFLACLIFMSVTGVNAQMGFNLYNQRNHPELQWSVLETAHFKIMYHQRIENVAVRAAQVAEECYVTLTQNLHHSPAGKIPIYLSDQDEIANGFDLSNRYIMIWVQINNYVLRSTGSDKWLRKVIAHELVHYIHFSAISTWLGFLGHGFTQTPLWFIEGLAQYESETWNVHRGDLVLRTRVVEDELNYATFRYPTDGALMYAAGNSAVRYLAERYGDSTLIKILQHRSKILVPYYEFKPAFQAALHKSPEEFLREWRKHVNIYYNAVYAQKEEIAEFSRPLKLPVPYIYDFKISQDSIHQAIVGIAAMDEPRRKLYLVGKEPGGAPRVLEHSNVLPGISFSPDGRKLVYAKFRRAKYGTLLPDLMTVDLSGKKNRITTNLRACMPDWSPSGDWIVCVSNHSGTANLLLVKPDGSASQILTHFRGDVQLSMPTWSPDGKWIACMRADSTGQRDIIVVSVDGNSIFSVTNDPADNRNPVWSPDGQQIAFTSYRTGIPNLFAKKFDAGQISQIAGDSARQITDAAQGLYALNWDADSLTALVLETKTRRTLHRLPVDRTVTEKPIVIKAKYQAWQKHQPPQGIPPLNTSPTQAPGLIKKYPYHALRHIQHYFTVPLPLIEDDRYGISIVSYFAEPLGKHHFFGLGDLATRDSRYIFTYLNNQWHPTISLSVFYFPLAAQLFSGELLIEEQQGVSLNADFPFNFGNDLSSNHLIRTRISWLKNHPVAPEWFEQHTLQPETSQIGEFFLGYQWRVRRRHRWNVIHPLYAQGLRLQLRLADRRWKSQLTYRLYELDTYFVRAFPWRHHVFYSRAKIQWLQGDLLKQHQIGFDKYDQLDFGLGLPLGDRERLRGIHEYKFGNRLVFGSFEYRFPLLDNLNWYVTRVSLGRLTGAFFLDWGAVWRHEELALRKIRLSKTCGFELKNQVQLAGFSFTHSLGFAAEWTNLEGVSEIYYRIRTVLPF